MGRAKGSGNVFDSIIRESMPMVPTENKGIMSGPMRKPRGGRRKIDRRGSFPKPGAGGRGFRQPPPGYKYDEIEYIRDYDLFLEENTLLHYKCTQYRDKASEAGVMWNDNSLNIKWPINNPILSRKDNSNYTFNEIVNLIK